jgi:hypothetical protein
MIIIQKVCNRWRMIKRWKGTIIKLLMMFIGLYNYINQGGAGS